MINFVTKGIFNPWSDNDIRRYKLEGSQRDAVHYNSVHNMRILLTDENLFLCNIRQNDNLYQNFYLYALTNSCFLFVMNIIQLDIYRSNELIQNKITSTILSKLSLTQKCVSSYNGKCELIKDVESIDGSIITIKVNTSIEDFLFPREDKIIDDEILKKYRLMCRLYKQVMKEYDVLCKTIDKYNDMIDEKCKRLKNVAIRSAIRLGVRLIGIPIPPIFSDIDSLFELDYANMAEMASCITIDDCINLQNELI